jgi:prepilin-type N-terminal cleavage/methylation domain-containing protein
MSIGSVVMTPNTLRRERGMTLVEVMVSITVGLILLSGIISIFISNKTAYRLQESTNVLNENARYALNQMQYHLRMGDHWGGVERDSIEVDAPLAALGITTTCTESNAISATGFVGIEGGATSPLDCIDDDDYEPNTDILIVRFGEPERVLSVDVVASTDIFIRTAVGRRGVIFQGSNLASLPADIYDAADPDPHPIANYRYMTVIYYIRQCASQDAGTPDVCDAADDSTPTLARLVLSGTTLVQEDVVAGVEQMQISYALLDESVDPPNLEYKNATTIQANNEWAEVANIQVSLVIRAEEYDVAYVDNRTFAMYGGYLYTPVTADRNFRRKLFNFSVQIRNQTRA